MEEEEDEWDTNKELMRCFTLANNGQGLSKNSVQELLRCGASHLPLLAAKSLLCLQNVLICCHGFASCKLCCTFIVLLCFGLDAEL